MAPDDMAMRLKEIQDKVSESLQYSIDSLVLPFVFAYYVNA